MAWRDIELAQSYLESETGAIVRDWGGQVPLALVYANAYSVGMSSLAIHSLYQHLNALPGMVAERSFAWLDRHPGRDTPVLTIESQRPIADAAVIAASLSFEMDYFHLIGMLQRAKVPLRAAQREQGDPLVLLGGPAVSANPMPLAPLADAVVIGEIEPILAPLGAVLGDLWSLSRDQALDALNELPGVYVPMRHIGESVFRQQLVDLDAFPTTTTVIAPRAEFGDMHLIEVSRGCGRGCRFCLAGVWYRPQRDRSLEHVLEQARQGLARRGDSTRRIGLVGSAVSDYGQIEELVLALEDLGAQISVSSLRVRPLSPVLVDALARSGSRSITLAPEAGSERLRGFIRKGVRHKDIMRATELVQGRFDSLKLYFMIGLPTEEEQDIEDLLALVSQVKGRFDREVVVNLTPFVPKAHTPFERMPMATEEMLESRMARIRQGCRDMGVELRAEGVGPARVQGVLARGDSRIGEVLLDMPRPSPARFAKALARGRVDIDGELGPRSFDETLPWAFIQLTMDPTDCAPASTESEDLNE